MSETIRKTISLRNWVYNTYLSNSDNVSARIEELIIQGAENEISGVSGIKQKYLNLSNENKNLVARYNKLQQKYNKLRTDFNKFREKPENDPETQAQRILTESIKLSGALEKELEK